jgi:hypothetical protein
MIRIKKATTTGTVTQQKLTTPQKSPHPKICPFTKGIMPNPYTASENTYRCPLKLRFCFALALEEPIKRYRPEHHVSRFPIPTRQTPIKTNNNAHTNAMFAS